MAIQLPDQPKVPPNKFKQEWAWLGTPSHTQHLQDLDAQKRYDLYFFFPLILMIKEFCNLIWQEQVICHDYQSWPESPCNTQPAVAVLYVKLMQGIGCFLKETIMNKELCNLTGQENILVYNLKLCVLDRKKWLKMNVRNLEKLK